MICFLCPYRPRSVNKKGTAKYQERIKEYLLKYHPEIVKFNNEKLYGIVYYFHKRKTELDADNLSKPIWDALESILYNDDKIIKLRYSGVYDINHNTIKLDITKMPQNIYCDLLEYIDDVKCDDLLYIELGILNDSLYIIGGESYETL